MGSVVTVIVELNRGGDRVLVSREMDVWIVENAFVPLGLPSLGADSFSKMLCTDAATIQATMKSRSRIAKGLSERITEALLAAMGAGDTEMGYPLNKNAK